MARDLTFVKIELQLLPSFVLWQRNSPYCSRQLFAANGAFLSTLTGAQRLLLYPFMNRLFHLLGLSLSLCVAESVALAQVAPRPPIAPPVVTNPKPFPTLVPVPGLVPLPEITPPQPTITLAPPPLPTSTPAATATPFPPPTEPPLVQAYAKASPHPYTTGGRTYVPLTFFADNLGASVGEVTKPKFQLLWFGQKLDFWVGQRGATLNDKAFTLPARPVIISNRVFVPLGAFCDTLGIGLKTTSKPYVFLLTYKAARVDNVRSTVSGNKVRTVVTFSNPTRVTASVAREGATFQFSGARAPGIPSIATVNDYLVTRTVLTSGNWNARFALTMNYAAPIQWFTLGSPPRLVIDSQRLFEESSTMREGGLRLTKVRRGTGHGPVQMWTARLDPRDGWRVRVEPGGYSVLQRARTSKLAERQKAILAVNGGFFAYDGAAVGAMLVGGEWIRLPWQGRTAVGFDDAGKAHIAPLQTNATVKFSSGQNLPIRDLNGWPDANRITALTRRFGTYYRLTSGEMAVVVSKGVVIARPGGGGTPIPANGFVLVASGSARQYLEKVALKERATLSITPIGWPKITTALGGGPRLIQNGQIAIRDENFRTDVTNGAGPRTAFGIDKQGRYIIVVVDGRQKYHSTGLTLHELAATMQQMGAVYAMNLDGGGSTAMAVKGRIVNRPSDGAERSVSNALLVMR
ncbi:hypothetical protein EON83_11640 [bacterium]|nr:MAG: hypothetical protein EON83_11640 [bacterium]